MKILILVCLSLQLITMPFSAYAEDLAPDVLVKKIAQDVLDIIKHDKDIKSGDKKKLIALVDAKVLPNFDFTRMTRLAMGKDWRKATTDQRETLVSEFRNLLVRTYTSSLARYRDQTVEVKPFKLPNNEREVTVRTQIIKSGESPVDVDYVMEYTVNGWEIFDMSVDAVSLVTTYRSTFTELVEQSGINGLIKILKEKNAANNVPD